MKVNCQLIVILLHPQTASKQVQFNANRSQVHIFEFDYFQLFTALLSDLQTDFDSRKLRSSL